MTSICSDLRILLENPPYVADVHRYWLEETDELSEAEQAARKAMAQWVKKVDAILELHKKDKELQIWRTATRPVSADFEDEDRNKALLQSINVMPAIEEK